MKEIYFYKTSSGSCPIEEFLDSLSLKELQKVLWTLDLIKESTIISSKYYKRLINTEGIIEIRVQQGNNNFRLLGFEHKKTLVILTNGFRKKDQKVPKKEIELAQRRKKEYLQNG